jgi:hypothetical protein
LRMFWITFETLLRERIEGIMRRCLPGLGDFSSKNVKEWQSFGSSKLHENCLVNCVDVSDVWHDFDESLMTNSCWYKIWRSDYVCLQETFLQNHRQTTKKTFSWKFKNTSRVLFHKGLKNNSWLQCRRWWITSTFNWIEKDSRRFKQNFRQSIK